MWELWAKTRREAPSEWHALPWHLIEVGTVGEQLWRASVPEPIKARWSARLGLDYELLARWIGFIAAIHDIGKASPKFQGLVPEQRQRHERSGHGSLLLHSDATVSLRHSLISAHVLPRYLEQVLEFQPLAASRYALVTGGHHGVLWSDRNLLNVNRHPDLVGTDIWECFRLDVLTWLREAFELPIELPGILRSYVPLYPEAMWLAGLITKADWIGSDEWHFSFRTDPAGPREAYETSSKKAVQALGRTGWYQRPLAIPARTFGDAIHTLPAGAEPYPAQGIAVASVQSMSSPGIAIVEYPMGWGKTEIALWIAAHWAESSGVPGFYIAMPTMTTSDQLHGRVVAHLESHIGSRLGSVNVQLLHGHAHLSTTPEIGATHDVSGEADQAEQLARHPDTDDTADSPVQRASWFTRKKRGLLATYGVGTVDQTLMAVLQVKHFFVRLHGLGGKTVIFDEVHSYDVYMSTLLDDVLRWLGALGSPVVILSATLPRERTCAMVAAYSEGAGWSPSPQNLAPYPRITIADHARMQSVHAPSPAEEERRTVALRLMPLDDDEAMWAILGARLDEALRGGGTAAVICNTVRQAQQAYRVLTRWFEPEHDQLTLFHARFRQIERRRIQEDVLARFGKQAGDRGMATRPPRHVVVATQVIEQSLDLDFDLLVSMFCPTDLLLQRTGRMQRHRGLDRLRPSRLLERPEVWLTGFNEQDGEPNFPRGSKAVYQEHVLLRSWLALYNRKTITIPDDVEGLIESTYGPMPDVPQDLLDVWDRSAYRWDEKRLEDREVARTVSIPALRWDEPAVGNDALRNITWNRREEEDDPFLHDSALAKTRIGPSNVSLVVLAPDEALMLSEALDPTRTERVALGEIRDLLLRTVSVSQGAVVRAARNAPVPATWERTAFLRHHRLVLLDDGHRGMIGGIRLHSHPTLGVLLDKDVDDQEDEQ